MGAKPTALGGARDRLRGAPALLIGCAAVGALSLLLPSAPSYDPWAWIVWGREILLLEFDTTGGPSWKPLPVAFTLLFAPLGEIDDAIPPALWLIVARAGAVLALVMAFRLARRLTGSDGPAGIGAGVLAAAALVLVPQSLRYTAHGNEVPLAIALMLWAVDRHLDGRHRATLVLGFLACLLRPEAFLFLALYGVWTWRMEPDQHRVLIGLAAALPALWLVPEWIGSGNPLDAGRQATSEPSWRLSRVEQPWLAVLERMHEVVGWPAEVGSAIALAFAFVRRERAVLVLSAAAVLWLGLVVAMTEIAFSGNPRYFLPAAVICCVLAGVGAAWLVAAAGRVHLVAGAAIASVLALATIPYLDAGQERLARQARLAGDMVELERQLGRAITAAGGRDRVAAPGPPSVNRVLMTQLAWETEWSMGRLERTPGRAIVFSAPYRRAGWLARIDPSGGGRHRLARVGPWDVLAPLPLRTFSRLPPDAPLLSLGKHGWTLPTGHPGGTPRAPRAAGPSPR